MGRYRRIVRSFAVSAALSTFLASNAMMVNAEEWVARGVDEVSADVQSTLNNGSTQYLIRWGDTLDVISRSVNIRVDVLQDWNAIYNADLIYAGEHLQFVDNVLTVSGQDGYVLLEKHVEPHQRIYAELPAGLPIVPVNLPSDAEMIVDHVVEQNEGQEQVELVDGVTLSDDEGNRYVLQEGTFVDEKGRQLRFENGTLHTDDGVEIPVQQVTIAEPEANDDEQPTQPIKFNDEDGGEYRVNDDGEIVDEDGNPFMYEGAELVSTDDVVYRMNDDGLFENEDGEVLTLTDGRFLDEDGEVVNIQSGKIVDSDGNEYNIERIGEDAADSQSAQILFPAMRRTDDSNNDEGSGE